MKQQRLKAYLALQSIEKAQTRVTSDLANETLLWQTVSGILPI